MSGRNAGGPANSRPWGSQLTGFVKVVRQTLSSSRKVSFFPSSSLFWHPTLTVGHDAPGASGELVGFFQRFSEGVEVEGLAQVERGARVERLLADLAP